MPLTFDEESHTYRLDGVVLPNVTTILQDCGLVDYSALPEAQRMIYLLRGRAVHIATQYDDEGDLDIDSVPSIAKPYLAAWRKFKDETGWQNESIEQRVFSELYGYAGTLDRTGRITKSCSGKYDIRKPAKYLLDIKTGKAEFWVRFQTAAYAGTLPDPRTYWRIGVELHNDGTYSVPFEMPPQQFHADWQVFMCALGVYNAKRQYSRKVKAA